MSPMGALYTNPTEPKWIKKVGRVEVSEFKAARRDAEPSDRDGRAPAIAQNRPYVNALLKRVKFHWVLIGDWMPGSSRP